MKAFLLFFLLVQSLYATQTNTLKINVISWKNGVGLSQDIKILEKEFAKLGYHVNFIDVRDVAGQHPKADLNVFVEVYNETFMPIARKNYLLPNPEWTPFSPQAVALFDMILCKTKEGERIYKTLNPNTVFLGYTCEDRYQSSIAKDYNKALHLGGASVQKGTDPLAKMWVQNPHLPHLSLLKHKAKPFLPDALGDTSVVYRQADNLQVIYDYLSESSLISLQNSCGLHICPSETEGFGYYIVEALSCAAVVVTTDAPPMNEFITDRRCLVGYNRTAPWRLATNYYFDPMKLEQTVTNLLKLSPDELKDIGEQNRKLYLENDRLFKQRFAEIFNEDSILQPKQDHTEAVFTNIVDHHFWGRHPFGEGSLPENTKLYRLFLQNFLAEHDIHQVIDIGCGDWESSKLLDWRGIHYTGYDVICETIEKNRAQFSSPTIHFIHANAVRTDLPKADLLICKDVLQHLPNDEISLLLQQLYKFKHCLIINDVDPKSLTSNNPEIRLGAYHHVDLTKAPFNVSGVKILTFVSGAATKQIFYICNESKIA